MRKRSHQPNLRQESNDGKHYKRVVSIYQAQSQVKPKGRRSNADMYLQSPYEERRGVSNDHVSLPDIYNANAPRIGQPYPYKSTLDQQNSAMINKLLNRKKSYERMMRAGDEITGKNRGGYLPNMQDSRSTDQLPGHPIRNRPHIVGPNLKKGLYQDHQGAPRKINIGRGNRPEDYESRHANSSLDVNGHSISQKQHQLRARNYSSQPEL